MWMARTALAALVLGLSACGPTGDEGRAETNAVAKKQRPDVPVSMKERDPEAYRRNVGSVMAEVPAEKQEDFKKLMACKVRQAAAAGKPVVVNTVFLAGLLKDLNTNPDALLGCE
jgi:hypothetical protein